MAKTLYVPDHIAAKVADKKPTSVEEAYVNANEKVLDPSLLKKTLKERLPQPTGWRLLVMQRNKGNWFRWSNTGILGT